MSALLQKFNHTFCFLLDRYEDRDSKTKSNDWEVTTENNVRKILFALSRKQSIKTKHS